MEFLKKALPILSKLVLWVTPKKVLLFSFFVVVFILSITLFEQRSSFYVPVEDVRAKPPIFGPKIVLSRETTEMVRGFVDRSSDINFATVISADIRFNQQRLLFFYSDDSLLKLQFQKYIDSHGTIMPLFTGVPKENEQVVIAINGEFGCYKFEDTSFSRVLIEENRQTKIVCKISLPPYYGEFSGFIVFGMNEAPTATRLDELQHEVTMMATQVYFKNFK